MSALDTPRAARLRGTSLAASAPAALLLVYFLGAVNLTGFPWVAWSGNMWGGNEFGWPFTYMSVPLTPSQWNEAVAFRRHFQGGEAYRGFVTPLRSPWGHEVEGFEPGYLAANIVIVAVLAASVFIVMYICQRFRERPMKFTVRYLLVLLTVAAAMTGGLGSGDVYLFYCRHTITMYLAIACAAAVVLFLPMCSWRR